MDSLQKKQRSKFYDQVLLENILPFWFQHGVDSNNGGIFTSLDQDGSILDTDKGVWQQGRFAWLLGEFYNNKVGANEFLLIAESTGKFLTKYCFDSSDGRMWFHVDREGKPIRKRRYAFSESFAAIAFGELAKATGNADYRNLAMDCFRAFLNHDPDQSEFGPKFTGQRKSISLGLPMITIVTAQELRDSIDLPNANKIIDQAISTIERFHLNEVHQCVMETMGVDGKVLNHFDGRTLNPGHAIEGAWFILEEGRVRGSERLVELGCKMLDWMWQRGWDQECGGMLYFTSLDGRPIQEYWHDMKFWWPHNETIIATLYAYLLTGRQKYLDWYQQVHDWSFQHFPDPENGEWFGYLRKDGSVSSRAKGNLWKGPFHLPRMLYKCSQLLKM